MPRREARLRRRLAIALAAGTVLLSGCASGPPPRLHFGMEEAPEGKRVLFPSQPEVPRYFYAGQLTGESNFKYEEGAADTAGADLYQNLPRPDLRRGKFLQADIVIVVVFGDQHMD